MIDSINILKNAKEHIYTSNTCSCERKILLPEDSRKEEKTNISYHETTCGRDAFRRGSGQKVIGFSFYGDINAERSKAKGFFEGIEGNLNLIPKYYPEWIMRVYFDLDPNDPIFHDLCRMVCTNPSIDICNVRYLPGVPMKDASKVFAMNWRFFPTLDPQVTHYLSRDLDSRLNEREYFAVQEWLQNSNYAFHIMRDNPAHWKEIVGCCWGTRLVDPEVRIQWVNTWMKGLTDERVWAERSSYGPDQEFLWRYVWPWAKTNSLGHDSYLCRGFPFIIGFPFTKGFPTRRKMEPNNFVGAIVKVNHTLRTKCPERCRPKDHMDWEYC